MYHSIRQQARTAGSCDSLRSSCGMAHLFSKEVSLFSLTPTAHHVTYSVLSDAENISLYTLCRSSWRQPFLQSCASQLPITVTGTRGDSRGSLWLTVCFGAVVACMHACMVELKCHTLLMEGKKKERMGHETVLLKDRTQGACYWASSLELFFSFKGFIYLICGPGEGIRSHYG